MITKKKNLKLEEITIIILIIIIIIIIISESGIALHQIFIG